MIGGVLAEVRLPVAPVCPILLLFLKFWDAQLGQTHSAGFLVF